MTAIHTTPQTAGTTHTALAPRLSLTRDRLHFVSSASATRQSPRLRLTRGLVGGR